MKKAFLFRVTEGERATILAAVDGSGLTVTAWLRGVALKAAVPAGELRHAGTRQITGQSCDDPACWCNRVPGRDLRIGPRKTAAELAASIPGVRLGGFGGMDMPIDVGNAPVEDVATRPWLPLWTKTVLLINDDPDTFYETMARLAPGWKPRQEFWSLRLERQAEVLDEKYPLEAEEPGQ